jgi:hypothetical protein
MIIGLKLANIFSCRYVHSVYEAGCLYRKTMIKSEMGEPFELITRQHYWFVIVYNKTKPLIHLFYTPSVPFYNAYCFFAFVSEYKSKAMFFCKEPLPPIRSSPENLETDLVMYFWDLFSVSYFVCDIARGFCVKKWLALISVPKNNSKIWCYPPGAIPPLP